MNDESPPPHPKDVYSFLYYIIQQRSFIQKKNPTNTVTDKDHVNRALCPENVTLPHPHA
jgi:hypothetical protein